MKHANSTLTCVAMSPFSSTIDGGRSVALVVSAAAAAAAVGAADAWIHRLDCRRPEEAAAAAAAATPRLALAVSNGESPGQARLEPPAPPAPREEHERRRSDGRKADAFGTKAAAVEKDRTATDLRQESILYLVC